MGSKRISEFTVMSAALAHDPQSRDAAQMLDVADADFELEAGVHVRPRHAAIARRAR